MYILYLPYMGQDSLVPPPKVPHPILLIWPHSLEVLIVAWCAGCRCDHWVSSKLSLKFHWTCSCLQVHIAMPCFFNVVSQFGMNWDHVLSIEEMDVHHFACPTVIEIAGPNYHGTSNQRPCVDLNAHHLVDWYFHSASLLKEPSVIFGTFLIEKSNRSSHVSVLLF